MPIEQLRNKRTLWWICPVMSCQIARLNPQAVPFKANMRISDRCQEIMSSKLTKTYWKGLQYNCFCGSNLSQGFPSLNTFFKRIGSLILILFDFFRHLVKNNFSHRWIHSTWNLHTVPSKVVSTSSAPSDGRALVRAAIAWRFLVGSRRQFRKMRGLCPPKTLRFLGSVPAKRLQSKQGGP